MYFISMSPLDMRWRMELKTAIRRLRTVASLNQGEFADVLGVTQPTVSRWERGSKPEFEHVAKLKAFADERGIDFDLSETGWETGWTQTVSIFGYVGAGAEVTPILHDDNHGIDHAEVDFPIPDGTGAVIVRGDSQMPVFEDGDLVGYHKEGRPPHDLIGRTCILRLADGRMYIKKLRRGSSDGLYTLVSSNAADIEDVVIEWAAPFRFRIPREEWSRM
ncbi:XRE family transcriptional regulator [Aminobacter aganoensis]|uniref:Transcriptional regulator with XRE-family HTH domain n=1 Tax=Aminobacter aganoensis TaxID=83264 RepID=A0A7X0KJY1_9HYPH|nr:transcriptional regulator with XRE-family HTH domain [Aminobacter aganoensis]